MKRVYRPDLIATTKALAPLGSLFLLAPHARRLKVLPPPCLYQNAISLKLLVEATEQALEALSSFSYDFRQSPSLPSTPLVCRAMGLPSVLGKLL